MSTPTTANPEQKVEADPFRYGWRYVRQQNERGETVTVQVPLKYEDLLHPQEEDFIVQNLLHDRDCRYLAYALELAMNGQEGARVAHDVRVDWEVAGLEPHGPDLAVFLAMPDIGRNELVGTIRVKQLGARPILVVEVTSPNTRSNDLVDKVVEYHKAGVPLYAIVDYRPELELRGLHILGYRWTPEGYLRLATNERGRLWLEPVKLWLAAEGDRAVCFDAQGQRIAQPKEIARSLKQIEARVEELESQTEEAIQAKKDADRLREQEEKARKEAEARAADEEKSRKEAESKAADLAAKLADMEAELRRLRGSSDQAEG